MTKENTSIHKLLIEYTDLQRPAFYEDKQTNEIIYGSTNIQEYSSELVDSNFAEFDENYTLEEIANNFLPALPYYLAFLKEAHDKLCFSNIEQDEKKKESLRQNLLIAAFLLNAQLKVEKQGNVEKNKVHYLGLIQQCHEYLSLLEKGSALTIEKKSFTTKAYNNVSDLIGALVADFVNTEDLEDTFSNYLLSFTNKINIIRLDYWAFSNADLISIEMPFFNTQKTGGQNFDTLCDIGGHLSYILYTIRLGLLLRQWHKYGWDNLSDEDKDILENDIIWLPLNALTFWMLTGNKSVGHGLTMADVGCLATIGGLLHDMVKNLLIFLDTKQTYDAQVSRQKLLQARILALEKKDANHPLLIHLRTELLECNHQIQTLYMQKLHDLRNFHSSAWAVVGVALSVLGHTMGPLGTSFMTVGAILNFVNVLSNLLLEQGLEMYASAQALAEIEKKIAELENTAHLSVHDSNALLTLKVDKEYHNQLEIYQWVIFFKTLVVKVVIHTLMILSISFLPLYLVLLSIGTAAIQAWLLENLVINPLLKPERDEIYAKIASNKPVDEDNQYVEDHRSLIC